MSGVILTWLHHDVAAFASILGPMSSRTLADSQWPNEPLQQLYKCTHVLNHSYNHNQNPLFAFINSCVTPCELLTLFDV